MTETIDKMACFCLGIILTAGSAEPAMLGESYYDDVANAIEIKLKGELKNA